MNRRAEIRAALKSVLLNRTEAEDRIFTSRMDPLQEDELPCIRIYDDSETAEETGHQGMLLRTMSVTIDAREAFDSDGNGESDDALDLFGADIESAISQAALASPIRSVSYKGSDKEVSADAERSVGAIKLSFEVTYLTDT